MISTWYSETNGVLSGFQLYDAEGVSLFKSPYTILTEAKCITTELQPGERIVGFKSRNAYDDLSGLHYDFKFIIGKMD